MPRHLERKTLIYHLEVLDRETDENIGFLGNITTKGILLFSQRAITPNRTFSLKLNLPIPVDGSTHIPLVVTSVWCRWDERLDMYAAGFQIQDASFRIRTLIADAIAQLGSSPEWASLVDPSDPAVEHSKDGPQGLPAEELASSHG